MFLLVLAGLEGVEGGGKGEGVWGDIIYTHSLDVSSE